MTFFERLSLFRDGTARQATQDPSVTSLFAAPSEPLPLCGGALPSADGEAPSLSFDDVYEGYFDFVWRSVRRLGVPQDAVDDAVQDVFVVVHRRLSDFEGRSSLKTWLFGIVVHVARAHRRRRAPEGQGDPDELADSGAWSQEALTSAAEAKRVLHEVLDTLSDERREIFVLMELEEMTAPECAEALSLKLNTVYSRLRAARQDFEAEVARRAAREGWRMK